MSGKFCVIRFKKHKSAISLRNSLKHAFREQNTPNADATKTPDNSAFVNSNTADSIQYYNAKIRHIPKIRKDAVRAEEFLIASSPEVMHGKTREEQDAYFADSLAYLENKFGKENVIAATIHRDETTPHLSVFIVPLDKNGKLNHSHFLGGSKHVLSDLQTDFAKKVGEKHGMERGELNSKATHTTIREFYVEKNKAKKRVERAEHALHEFVSLLTPLEHSEVVARLHEKRNAESEQKIAHDNGMTHG
jgi:hypothetical protein